MKQLRGLFTALVTPFDTQGKVDEEGLRRNLRYQLHHQVDGIVVLGTTGESPTLTHQEKEKILKIALEEVKGKTTLIVGTGTYSTQQTIETTKWAQANGADAALIVTPYYNKPTQEGLYRHFASICDTVSLPICVYNVPGRTSQNLQTETVKRLIAFSSIIAIKESANIQQINDIMEIARKNQPNFSILSGDDYATFPLMALGGSGVISVVSNLIPGPIKQLVHAALAKDFETARQLHYQLLPLFNAAFIETNPIPIKTAMNLCGMAAGSCRLPMCDLSAPHSNMLKRLLSTFPESWFRSHG